MKWQTKYLLIFLTVFAALTLLAFVAIQLDLWANSWLRQAVQEWKWYNYFTSSHGLTGLYLRGWLWLIPPAIISTILSLLVILYDHSTRRY